MNSRRTCDWCNLQLTELALTTKAAHYIHVHAHMYIYMDDIWSPWDTIKA